jgi:hypothetical protein
MSTTAFRWSDDREPHRARTQALLKSHPELRRFIGRNPMTGVMIGATVVLQLAFTFAFRPKLSLFSRMTREKYAGGSADRRAPNTPQAPLT